MTGPEQHTLERLFELTGSTAGKVDMILLQVGGIDDRLRKVETATAADRAVDESNDRGARDRSITRQWVIGIVLATVLGTATIVASIAGVLVMSAKGAP